jgi:E3 ubiquitin-protein ligase RNF19A
MHSSARHKRNLAVTGGVVSAIIISPVLAGLAVGLGVPILLAYVYGVVPISLCRSGGCGLATSPSGVKLDFDESDRESIDQPSAVISHNGLTRQSTRSNGE